MANLPFDVQDTALPVFFPGGLFRALRSQGICAGELLKDTQLTPDCFFDENIKISFIQHKQFIKNAIESVGDSHLGWWYGKQINVSSLGLLGYAAMSCRTVGDAMETIAHYSKIRAPLYGLSLLNETARINESALQINEMADFAEIRYFLLSSALSGSANLLAYYSQQAQCIQRIELTIPQPRDWDSYTSQVDWPVLFGQPFNRLVFSSDILQKNILTADPGTEKSIKEICNQLLFQIESQEGVTSKVRQFILEQHEYYPNLVETAAFLCVSPRTLRRKLQQVGTTYQAVLDDVRKTIAIEYLTTTTKPINHIAFELGFNDKSNFGRAFKRWTGKRPGEYRHH